MFLFHTKVFPFQMGPQALKGGLGGETPPLSRPPRRDLLESKGQAFWWAYYQVINWQLPFCRGPALTSGWILKQGWRDF